MKVILQINSFPAIFNIWDNYFNMLKGLNHAPPILHPSLGRLPVPLLPRSLLALPPVQASSSTAPGSLYPLPPVQASCSAALRSTITANQNWGAASSPGPSRVISSPMISEVCCRRHDAHKYWFSIDVIWGLINTWFKFADDFGFLSTMDGLFLLNKATARCLIVKYKLIVTWTNNIKYILQWNIYNNIFSFTNTMKYFLHIRWTNLRCSLSLCRSGCIRIPCDSAGGGVHRRVRAGKHLLGLHAVPTAGEPKDCPASLPSPQ